MAMQQELALSARNLGRILGQDRLKPSSKPITKAVADTIYAMCERY
jgi:hypothetical protein